MPDIIDYSNLKQNITTRAELNRQIKSLRRFMKDDAESIYTTEAGEKITKWQKDETLRSMRVAKNRLTRELRTLETPTSNGYSRAQMGSERVAEIKAELATLNSKRFETKMR